MMKEAVFNEASRIYNDPERSESRAYNDMQKFLHDRAEKGVITKIESFKMARKIMEDADPVMAYDLEIAGL